MASRKIFPRPGTPGCFRGGRTGDVDAMLQLLDDGAEVDQTLGDGVTPLWKACAEGHLDAARLLLERGAQVRPGERRTVPRYSACRRAQAMRSIHIDSAGSRRCYWTAAPRSTGRQLTWNGGCDVR